MFRLAIAAMFSLALGSTGCSRIPGAAQPQADSKPAAALQHSEDTNAAAHTAFPQRLAVEHLPNAYRVADKVISGGLPEGDAAFAELADLGVKTVISVDGMRPDVDTAKRHGLRYVHLPHGYDGISTERSQQLAKAVRDLPSPIYIHCHHGKHRSPAAAAVACVGAGLIAPSLAERILATAGTNENYRGLYAAAREARLLDVAFLDALSVEFREQSEVPPMADAMVALEHTHAHMKQIEAAGWTSPTKHPDLDPAHEALLLREHLTEMLRMDDVSERPAGFADYLSASETAAHELEDALREIDAAGNVAAAQERADRAASALARVTASCTDCHREFRDNAGGGEAEAVWSPLPQRKRYEAMHRLAVR